MGGDCQPRVWQWLCLQAVQREMGAVPALQVKRVTVPIPNGCTIVVDYRSASGQPVPE